MAGVSWIKIMVDVFDHRKIRQIESMPEADSIIVIWFKLLTLAGRINDGGIIYFTPGIPYTEEMLATAFGRPLNTVRLALKVFQQFHMIEIVDDFIQLPGWQEYQNVDGMDRIREQTRERVSAYRARQKQSKLLTDSQKCNVTGNVTLTHGNAIEEDIDKDIDIKEKDKKKSGARFAPPGVEEVREYIREKGYHVDADVFCAHYDSNGWKVGRNPMKDWKRALVTWEKRRQEDKPRQQYEEPQGYRYKRFTDDGY